MEIDARLLKFKDDISPYINNLAGESKILTEKLNNYCSITDSASDVLDGSFNTKGISSIKKEISNMSFIAKTISDSIFSELDVVIEKCRTLSTGIADLEALLEEYKLVINKSDYNDIKAYEKEFKKKQDGLLALYNEIASADLASSKLTSLSKEVSAGSIDSDNKDSLCIHEQDGVIYQKSMPIFRGRKYNLTSDINIIYDANKISLADKEAGEEALKYLRTMMKQNKDSEIALWDYQKKKFSNNVGIAKVMDEVLEESYISSKCSTISQYAAVAATVLSQGLVNLKYGSSSDKGWNSLGFDTILDNGASLTNSEFINWCYTQGLKKTRKKIVLEDDTISNICQDFSKDVTGMTYEELCNLENGSCLTKYIKGRENFLIGMVIGYTKVGGEPSVVVAQALSNKSGSYCSIYKVKDCFGNSNNKWQGYVSTNIIENELKR